jgi:drug/metabolite transporter (DMT)-like permease
MIGGAALFGASTALLWGVSDVIARLSGRAAGVLATTLAMMVVGAVATLLYIAILGRPVDWDPQGYWLIAASGVGTALGTIMIYAALTRGPLSLASPAVASYPAITVPISVALGARVDLFHWLAMAATMAGVWLVARAVGAQNEGGRPDYAARNIRITLLLSVGSAVLFALALIAADLAMDRYGWEQTLLGSRLVGCVMFGALALLRPNGSGRRPIPRRALPLMLLLGLLDTGGHASLYAGLALPNGEFAVVASAAYTAVTTVTARHYFREPVAPIQWVGIALIIAGVGVLAGVG